MKGFTIGAIGAVARLPLLKSTAGVLMLCVCATASAAGNASAPAGQFSAPGVGDVSISTTGQTPTDSSFNASVVNSVGKVSSSFAASPEAEGAHLIRLESNWQRPLEGQTLGIGDAVSNSSSWGTSVRYGGVQFGTPMTANEDVVTQDRLAAPGAAILPSAADILLSNSGRPAPGLNLDAPAQLVGPNTLSFSVHDSYGRTQVILQPLFAKTTLPSSEGCGKYSFGVGKVREDYAMTSNQYGSLFANATVRCGVSPSTGVEGHGEYLDGQTALGVNLAQGLGSLGIASAAVASSRDPTRSGWLAQMGMEHSGSVMDLMVRTQMQSRGYRATGTDAALDPISQRTLTSLGVKTSSAGRIGVAYVSQTTFDHMRDDVLAVSQSMRMARGQLSVTAGHSVMQNQATSVALFYSRPFGKSSSASSAIGDYTVLPAFDPNLFLGTAPAHN